MFFFGVLYEFFFFDFFSKGCGLMVFFVYGVYGVGFLCEFLFDFFSKWLLKKKGLDYG